MLFSRPVGSRWGRERVYSGIIVTRRCKDLSKVWFSNNFGIWGVFLGYKLKPAVTFWG